MNHFITTHTGFHPIQLEDFAFLQEAYKEGFNALGRMLLPDGIEAAILTGCQLEIVGNDYSLSEGYVFYQGEIFAVASDAGSFVDGEWPCLSFVVEYADFNPVEYYDKTLKYVHQIRTMSFAFESDTTGKVDFIGLRRASDIFAAQYGLSPTTGEQITDLENQLVLTQDNLEQAKLDLGVAQQDITDLQDRVGYLETTSSPVGSIIMIDYESIAYIDFSTGLGLEMFENWALCDGRNGTPDLRGRFVVGMDADNPDYYIETTGGEESVTLTETQMPAHTHEFDQYQTDRQYNEDSDGATMTKSDTMVAETDVAGGVLVDAVNNVYETAPHENRPPYYTLAFIKRIA